MSLILLFMISLLPIQHGSIVKYTCKAIYYESYKSSPAYLHFPNLATVNVEIAANPGRIGCSGQVDA